MRTTLIGRDVEMDSMRALLRRVEGGFGAAIVIEGEAGSGKTRLLHEFVAHARESGVRVWHGAAEEFARARPFGALADAFRTSGLPMTDAATADHIAARYQVIDDLLDYIEHSVATGPVVLALDDLHWADPSTLLAVHGLTKRMFRLAIALAVTIRPLPTDDQLDRLLETLNQIGAHHLRLRPLDTESATTLLAEALGATPGPGLLNQVQRAAGNPFYLHELAKTLAREDCLVITAGVAEIDHSALPVTLGTTILRQLRFLGGDALSVLQHAAILGNTFSAAELAAVCGHSPDRLLSALQEAVRADLIQDSTGGFAFRHDLVREALYERIPRGIRGDLHAAAGTALAAAGAAVTRVATQFGRGAKVGDQTAISYLRSAAEQTWRSAPEIAAGFLRRAMDLCPPAEHDRIRLDLACALVGGGSGSEAYRLIQETPSTATEFDGELAYVAGQALLQMGRVDEGLHWLKHSAASTSSSDAERALLLAEAAVTRVLGAADVAGAEDDIRCAASLIESDPGGYAAGITASARSLIEWFRGEAIDAERSATHGVELVRNALDPRRGQLPSLLRDPFVFRGIAQLDVDLLDEAAESFRSGQRLAAERGAIQWSHAYHFWLGIRHFYGGDWDDAIAELETGFSLADELDNRAGSLGAHALRAVIAIHRDDLAVADHHLSAAESLADGRPTMGTEWVWLAQSMRAEAAGDNNVAYQRLAEAWDRLALLDCRIHYRTVGPALVRHAIATGERERAEEVTAAVEALADRHPVASLLGTARHCRALVDPDVAVFDAAQAAYRDAGRPQSLASACEDSGTTLIDLGDEDAARGSLTAALDGFESLDATWDASRVAASLRDLGVRTGVRGPRGRSSFGWDSLTPTERRVAELVSAGLSNPEIGTRLFISRRTVQTHVSHIFTKLDLTSRTELAAAAARRGSAL